MDGIRAIKLRGANGLPIPYLGYLELQVELCSRLLPGCGLLVVKDPRVQKSPNLGCAGDEY